MASLTLYIGNRTYSSWSLRGWLAVKLADIEADVRLIRFDSPEWQAAAADPAVLPSRKVPTLWDGDVAVWETTAIIDYLAARVGLECFWPSAPKARGLAMAIAAEMHAGFQAIRSECPMNLRKRWADFVISDACRRDIDRIEQVWQQARALATGGEPFLFGDFCAADVMYAPVVTRFDTYGLPVSAASRRYIDAVLAHPWMKEWTQAAMAEPWIVDIDEVAAPPSHVLW
jgi:glutathione S-transferase